MKTYVNLYLPEFFLEWEMFRRRGAEEIETHVLYSVTDVAKGAFY